MEANSGLKAGDMVILDGCQYEVVSFSPWDKEVCNLKNQHGKISPYPCEKCKKVGND